MASVLSSVSPILRVVLRWCLGVEEVFAELKKCVRHAQYLESDEMRLYSRHDHARYGNLRVSMLPGTAL